MCLPIAGAAVLFHESRFVFDFMLIDIGGQRNKIPFVSLKGIVLFELNSSGL